MFLDGICGFLSVASMRETCFWLAWPDCLAVPWSTIFSHATAQRKKKVSGSNSHFS